MNNYIKPITKAIVVSTQQMMAGSPGIDTSQKVDNPSLFDSKDNDYPTPGSVNLWED